MHLIALLGTSPAVEVLQHYRDPTSRFHLHAVPAGPVPQQLSALPALGFTGALLFGSEVRRDAVALVRASVEAADLQAVNVVSVAGGQVQGDYVGAAAVVDGLRHAGWDPRGARVVASGGHDDVRSLLRSLATAGVVDITLVGPDAPAAERALPALPAGVKSRALPARDPIIPDLVARCDAVLRGDGNLKVPAESLGPHLTLVDVSPNLPSEPRATARAAGVSTIAWADVEAHRVAATLQQLLSLPVDPAPLHELLRTV